MPSISSTGGIFLRLDSSGNLTIYDTTGTIVAKFIGGVFRSSFVQAQGTASGTTASTSFVSSAGGTTLIPRVSSNALLLLGGFVSNATAGDGTSVAIFKNNTGIPALGTAVGTDTQVNTAQGYTSTAANQVNNAAFMGVDTGLTLGTQVWYYAAVKSLTGGTSSFNFVFGAAET